MRYIFFILLLLLPVQAWGVCAESFLKGRPPVAGADALTCHRYYAYASSRRSMTALWSAEHLTYEMLAARPRRTGAFDHNDPRFDDYAHSGYDRGHMTPSGDMPDIVSQRETFDFGNIVPQTAALNRHAWSWIENAVRRMVRRWGEVYVVTGPDFGSLGGSNVIGREGVWVPVATWKAIYDPVKNRAGAYYCTNTDEPTCYTLSIMELRWKVGINPFPALPYSAKNWRLPLWRKHGINR